MSGSYADHTLDGWISDTPIILTTEWANPKDRALQVPDVAGALLQVEFLYDFALLVAHPAYKGIDISDPNQFFTAGLLAIEPEHRLQVVSVEHHSPLVFLAAIPVAVAGVKGVEALVNTFEKIANFRLNRRKLKAEVEKAESEARRASAEADSAEFQRDIDRRRAEVTVERLRQQVQSAPMQLVDTELGPAA